MMTLDELRPSELENELTKDMPEQVAIGYIRARRRDHMTRNVPKMPFDWFPHFGGTT